MTILLCYLSPSHIQDWRIPTLKATQFLAVQKYMVIHKSLQDSRPLQYSRQYGHAEGEHVNRGRDTPSFCPTLQLLDMSTPGDEADVNPVIKFLLHTLQHLVVDSSDCLHDPLLQLW
jgi:hypothetical protein